MATAYALPLGLDTDPRASVVTASTINGTRPVSLSFSSFISGSTSSSENSRKQSISFSFVHEVTKATGHVIENIENDPTSEKTSDKPRLLYTLDTALSSDDRGNNTLPVLVEVDKLRSLNERSLAMHLYRSFQMVLACQEALREELNDRLRNRREELEPYGWEDDEEFEEPQNRKKFERILERYQT